jgi:hypothetical protein
MAEYYDSETLYDNPQLERLNEVLDSMTDAEFERKVYEVECQCEGLDPNHPESPKRLKKIKRQYKWKHQDWPTIRNTCDWWLMMYCFFAAGRNFANDLPWWTVVITLIGGIGWFNIFLTHKFGSDYIFKY